MFKLAQFMYELGIKMERRRVRMLIIEAQREYHIKQRGFDMRFMGVKEEPKFEDKIELEIDKRVAGILMNMITQTEVTKFETPPLDKE